jgi:hypothetical protein
MVVRKGSGQGIDFVDGRAVTESLKFGMPVVTKCFVPVPRDWS